MFADWTRGEILQLIGIVVASLATVVGVAVSLMVRRVYVLLNSRMDQVIAGAQAQGRLMEQQRSKTNGR